MQWNTIRRINQLRVAWTGCVDFLSRLAKAPTKQAEGLTMATPITEWTEPRIEQLNRLWGEGWSASIIARKIGGTTRNAVIGKVHRLGLPSRVARVRAKPNRLKPRQKPIASPWRSKAVFECPDTGQQRTCLYGALCR